MTRDNLFKVKARISAACARVKRDPGEITLVAVTKNRGVEEIKEILACGIADIGENRVQEALLKYGEIAPGKWHMIGHLQTNKTKEAVKIFGLIHSVDSLKLACEINKQAARINKVQDILIEVKTSSEVTKTGIAPQDALMLALEIKRLANLSLKGLMTIAPLVDEPQKVRPYFRQLRQLRERIGGGLPVLSMGMTDDFEVAIEEGATMVRIGRAIFE